MSDLNHQIDWDRVIKALIQKGKQIKIKEDFEGDKLNHLKELVSNICGEFSQNRKMAVRIGERILFTKDLTVIAPCCPDYSYENGRYNFYGLNGGVSLLTQKHIEFLKRVCRLFPNIKPLFIIADAEANDGEICRAVGKSKQEFSALVESSLLETQKILPLGYQIRLMTNVITNLVEEETMISEQIRRNQGFSARITSEALQRTDMYFKINPRFTTEEMKNRTIRTAAQYVALGKYSEKQGYLVCNHTTTSLNWYLQTKAAVLHNPISIY